jgi:hypothetical protein
VQGLEALGHQILHTHPVKRLGRRVTKDAGCCRIPEDYALGLSIRDDDPVPDPLEELAEV